MGLDIRLPIGLLFVSLGSLLVLYGFLSDPAIYARSLGININLWWGLVLFAFGALMTLSGRRAASAPPREPVAPSERPHVGH